MLARGGGVAMWKQIADVLSAEIAAGAHPRGGRLPVEAELADRFGVNRHTLRRAMQDLAERGLVRAQRGSGTYVEADPIAYPIGERTRFSDIMVAQAREPRGELVSAEEGAAGAQVAEALGLSPKASVLRMVSRHSADGVPISWAEVVLPLPRFAGIEKSYRAKASITRALAAFGVDDYRRKITRIGAAVADAVDATRLDVVAGRPVLDIESVNVDLHDVPIQWTRSRFAGDRVRVTIGG